MDINSIYYKQVQLVIRVLTTVAAQPIFALKGGTALNLFVRDLPRMSVDIDLTYIPKSNVQESVSKIKSAMYDIQADLQSDGLVVTASEKNGALTRLLVSNKEAQIKIETTPVLRETVHPVSLQSVRETVERQFGFVEIKTLDFNDLYAGKICAALDRQHPRDLFDVRILLDNEGIDEKLKNTFLVYLISHPRPMAELLKPNRKPLKNMFEREFEFMSSTAVSLNVLEDTREQLIDTIKELLTDFDKEFLLNIKQGTVKWAEFYYPSAQNLPAVAWKLINLDKMTSESRKAAYIKLRKALEA